MKALIEKFINYKLPYEADWAESIALYNLLQNPEPTNSKMSNFYLGTSRMLIDQSVSMMSEGTAQFLPEPRNNAEYKKVVLYKSLLDLNASMNNYTALTREFIINAHVFGTACLTSGVQSPMKKRRLLKQDGTIEELIVRDYDKPNVYIKSLSPMNCFRDDTTSHIAQIGRGGYMEYITRGEFDRKFANTKTKGGKSKYDTQHMSDRDKVKLTHYFDEFNDEYTLYAIDYGSSQSSGDDYTPPREQVGEPIFKSPITLYRKGTFSSGINALGKAPIHFARFLNLLDNKSGTHGLYGMGLPRMVNAPENIMDAMVNLDIDNMVLQNTVPISYEPFDDSTAADMEGVPMYSGQFVDGKVTPQPLGVSSNNTGNPLYEMLNSHLIWLTGINHRQQGGQTARTAFQFGVETQQNQDRAKKRLNAMADECFKPFGKMLLANSLASVTTEDWEHLTEKQIKDVAKKIKEKELFAEDVKFAADGKTPEKRRVYQYIKVRGMKFTEDHTQSQRSNKSLQLHPVDKNDREARNIVSFIPASEKYLLDNDDLDSILRWDVNIETKEMVSATKVRDLEANNKVLNTALILQQAGLVDGVDYQKFLDNDMRAVGMDPDTVKQDPEEKSELRDTAKKMYDATNDQLSQEINLPEPTLPEGTPPVATPPPASSSGTSSGVTRALEALSSGNL